MAVKGHMSAESRVPGAVYRARKAPEKTRLILFVQAGGRCEFDGCNRYMLEHHLTGQEGNFAQVAHICGFSDRGPWAGAENATEDVHDISNLMLLCPGCHKLVDDRPDEYTVEVLRRHKKTHEDRIFMLTDTRPDRHTVAVVFTAPIGGRPVSVSLCEMQAAVAPRYLGERDVVRIDLNDVSDRPTSDYWQTAAAAIRSKVTPLYEQIFSHGPARHLSVFALGPIPLLVYLGTCLSDKVPLTLYQRHRDTEGWRWKDSAAAAAYRSHCLRQGAGDGVAVLVSLSGRVSPHDLPLTIDGGFSLYEITLDDAAPTPWFLDAEESLHAFRARFQLLVREVVAAHPGLERLHLFPAVPAPVAVAVGRDLMPKRDPAVLVYDHDRRAGGFVPTLEVNSDET